MKKKIKGLGDTFIFIFFFTVSTSDCAAGNLKKLKSK